MQSPELSAWESMKTILAGAFALVGVVLSVVIPIWLSDRASRKPSDKDSE